MSGLKNLFSSKEKRNEVILYSYSKFIFVWPLIIAGFLLGITHDYQLLNPNIEAWIWISVLITVMLCLAVNVNRNLALFWFTFIFGAWFFTLWVDEKGIPILEEIFQFLNLLDLQYSAKMGQVISVALSIVYLIVLIDARMNGKWRFTQLEIEHHIAGKDRISLGRGFKYVKASYPDIFEFMVGLSGKMTIYNSQGDQVLETIEHIPFLPFRINKIEKIMGEMNGGDSNGKRYASEG